MKAPTPPQITLLILLVVLVIVFLASCVSYTYPLGESGRYGSITLSAKYNLPQPDFKAVLGYHNNIQKALKDK